MLKRLTPVGLKKTIVAFPGQGQVFPPSFLPELQKHHDLSHLQQSLSQSINTEFTAALFDSANNKAFFAKTSNLQPAIVSSSLLLLQLLNDKLGGPLHASYVMGHSLGELSALLANEVWDPKLAPVLAYKRGKFMEDAIDPNKDYGLIALMFSKLEQFEIINDLVNKYEGVAVANKNTATQVVLSGEKNELQKVIDEIKRHIRVKPIELMAQVPFHNPLLEEAAYEFTKFIDTTHPIHRSKELEVPIVSNLTGEVVFNHGDAVDKFIDGFFNPVLFFESVQQVLKQDGDFTLASFGPNSKVNQSLFQKTDISKKIISNVGLESHDDIESFASTLA